MANPGRRTHADATAAAEAASSAARVLQERSTEARQERQSTLHLPGKGTESPKAVESRQEAPPKVEVVDTERLNKIPRGNIHRDQMFDEIRAKRGEGDKDKTADAEANAAAQQKAEDTVPGAAKAEETSVVEKPAVEPVAAAEPAVEAAPEVVTVEMVTVKVDGEERQVPKSDVDAEGGVKAYQINRASENRLRQSQEALAETRRVQAELAAWAEKQAPKQPQVSDDQFIASKVDAIRYGSAEESAAALREVMARVSPRQDDQAIVFQATVNMKRDMALAQYSKDFQDVTSNPVLKLAADAIERNELMKHVKNGAPDWKALGEIDWQKFYGTIGTQVRNAMGTRPNQPAQSAVVTTSGTTSQLSEKEARKASIVEPPKAAAARAASKEEPTLTPEEARQASLREMRKSRGLPVD